HALFPHRNVADNVAFGLEMKQCDRRSRDRQTEAMLELVDLSGYGARRIDSLSGGEAQRVALARALAPAPRLLMLDEPLGSLDRALRDRLAVDVRSILNTLEQSAIHVTHDQDEAFAIADRVAVMRSGRIERIGTPVEIWRDPRSEFVARFLGHPNIVDGELFGGPSGQAVIRTETLRRLESEGAASNSGVVIEGVVSAQQFRGDHFRIRFNTAAGTELVAMSPIIAEVGDRVRYQLDPTELSPIAPDSL
ncbi:MAG: ABC transporter ATP-binding protein, partial [Acidimicrobiales bacterium]